jgi:hypothetical protein
LKNYYEIKTKNKNYQFSYLCDFLENELVIKAKNENEKINLKIKE